MRSPLFTHLQCAFLTSVDGLSRWSELHFSQAFTRNLKFCFQSKVSLDDPAFKSTRLCYLLQVLVGWSATSTHLQKSKLCDAEILKFWKVQEGERTSRGFSQPERYTLDSSLRDCNAQQLFLEVRWEGEARGVLCGEKTWQKPSVTSLTAKTKRKDGDQW